MLLFFHPPPPPFPVELVGGILLVPGREAQVLCSWRGEFVPATTYRSELPPGRVIGQPATTLVHQVPAVGVPISSSVSFCMEQISSDDLTGVCLERTHMRPSASKGKGSCFPLCVFCAVPSGCRGPTRYCIICGGRRAWLTPAAATSV